MTSPTIVPLTAADGDAILRVLQDDSGYAVRVNGQAADQDDVTRLLTERPPQTAPDNHHVMGLTVCRELVGVASLVVGWPDPEITYLGLLQIRADQQGRGLAGHFHELLRRRFPGRWRLAVVDTNAQAIPVWEHLGYTRTGVTTWTSSSGIQHDTVQMESPGSMGSRPMEPGRMKSSGRMDPTDV